MKNAINIDQKLFSVGPKFKKKKEEKKGKKGTEKAFLLHTWNSLLQGSFTAVGFNKSGKMLASASSNIPVEKSLAYTMLFDKPMYLR